ncbi:hypothetical protein GQ44DRAFT_771838 [Phaeosphaeriaceae sp. PMI808]|nr:hypothetical protein GQ44DRAFT_771838 [Phaeosphaeriaceae sp. PMI808]
MAITMLLLDLPTEFVILIIEHRSSKEDLNAFLQTSRFVYKSFNAYLYCFDMKYYRSSAICWAATEGQLQTARKTLEIAGSQIEAKPLRKALNRAVKNKHWAIVKLLVNEGADVNAEKGYFGNALHS